MSPENSCPNRTAGHWAPNDQRIQLDGRTTYKVRKPNGFVIDYESDIKSRRFVYDGKNFTVYSPKLGF
ncbi:DUF2092 domain-containing protein, partial [Salmonella enterica]|uniref:DUF2092 domain-containing protein n=1 Tax=Salmonella enterica TaxID=28901 RepID=UPI003D2AA4C3